MISKEELKKLLCYSCNTGDCIGCLYVDHVANRAKEFGLLTEPEMAWHQRSAEEIQASLDRLGYVKDDEGNWKHDIFPWFTKEMWEYCGQQITWAADMIPEWVELREVQE